MITDILVLQAKVDASGFAHVKIMLKASAAADILTVLELQNSLNVALSTGSELKLIVANQKVAVEGRLWKFYHIYKKFQVKEQFYLIQLRRSYK